MANERSIDPFSSTNLRTVVRARIGELTGDPEATAVTGQDLAESYSRVTHDDARKATIIKGEGGGLVILPDSTSSFLRKSDGDVAVIRWGGDSPRVIAVYLPAHLRPRKP